MLQCGFVRVNLALPIAAASCQKENTICFEAAGAGDGNRTHVTSLEGWSSTIELHPPIARVPNYKIADCRPAGRLLSSMPQQKTARKALVEGVGFEPT